MLPNSKTGRKAIRLERTGRWNCLQTVPRLEGNPYVICGEKSGQHLVNLEKPWRRIRAAAKLDDVRLHDLRHSFASVAASGGQSLIVIGKMLGHSQPATTARYAHLADDPVKAASDAVGGTLRQRWTAEQLVDVVDFADAKRNAQMANPYSFQRD